MKILFAWAFFSNFLCVSGIVHESLFLRRGKHYAPHSSSSLIKSISKLTCSKLCSNKPNCKSFGYESKLRLCLPMAQECPIYMPEFTENYVELDCYCQSQTLIESSTLDTAAYTEDPSTPEVKSIEQITIDENGKDSIKNLADHGVHNLSDLMNHTLNLPLKATSVTVRLNFTHEVQISNVDMVVDMFYCMKGMFRSLRACHKLIDHPGIIYDAAMNECVQLGGSPTNVDEIKEIDRLDNTAIPRKIKDEAWFPKIGSICLKVTKFNDTSINARAANCNGSLTQYFCKIPFTDFIENWDRITCLILYSLERTWSSANMFCNGLRMNMALPFHQGNDPSANLNLLNLNLGTANTAWVGFFKEGDKLYKSRGKEADLGPNYEDHFDSSDMNLADGCVYMKSGEEKFFIDPDCNTKRPVVCAYPCKDQLEISLKVDSEYNWYVSNEQMAIKFPRESGASSPVSVSSISVTVIRHDRFDRHGKFVLSHINIK